MTAIRLKVEFQRNCMLCQVRPLTLGPPGPVAICGSPWSAVQWWWSTIRARNHCRWPLATTSAWQLKSANWVRWTSAYPWGIARYRLWPLKAACFAMIKSAEVQGACLDKNMMKTWLRGLSPAAQCPRCRALWEGSKMIGASDRLIHIDPRQCRLCCTHRWRATWTQRDEQS